MTNYSSMQALEVWYAKIGVEDVIAAQSVEFREQVKQRIEKARVRSAPEFVFPKLVEQRGAAPRIRDEPPLIFHPSAKVAPPSAPSPITCSSATISRALTPRPCCVEL